MYDGYGEHPGELAPVRCMCGGTLREVDGWIGTRLVHDAACNRCGTRFAMDRVMRALDDARHLGVVVELPHAS